jgi:1,2-phenylacetyl-CoA epoxidase catalytic subunit
MSLSDLVLSIADNKQMLGLRYAEWATRAPSLEADIAAAAMGLDDLGHSRVLYGCLEPLGADPRGPQRESDPASLRAPISTSRGMSGRSSSPRTRSSTRHSQ